MTKSDRSLTPSPCAWRRTLNRFSYQTSSYPHSMQSRISVLSALEQSWTSMQRPAELAPPAIRATNPATTLRCTVRRMALACWSVPMRDRKSLPALLAESRATVCSATGIASAICGPRPAKPGKLRLPCPPRSRHGSTTRHPRRLTRGDLDHQAGRSQPEWSGLTASFPRDDILRFRAWRVTTWQELRRLCAQLPTARPCWATPRPGDRTARAPGRRSKPRCRAGLHDGQMISDNRQAFTP